MIPRTREAISLFAMCLGWSSPLSAQERWVDDERVTEAGRIRLAMGVGAVLFGHPTLTAMTHPQVGTGLNLQETAGLGNGVEVGVRFGSRLDDVGRGLRADEAARVFETETFGTGLSVTANPELRLRLRVFRWSWGEAGLEDRVVLPIKPDPDVTDVVGTWASVRMTHVGRVDMGLNSVVTWRSFEQRRIVSPALGMPVLLWVNVTRAVFAGLLTSLHYYASTPYTSSTTRFTAGLGLGYRLGACDLMQATSLPDAFGVYLDRLGLGLAVSCRM